MADRHEEVSGYLGSWAGDLEYAQSESLKALTSAQHAALGRSRHRRPTTAAIATG